MRSRRGALTLTELLTVVSVIGILASMISPVLIRGRQEAIRHVCISNLRQIHVAAVLYAGLNNGMFPNCFDLASSSGNSNPIETSWWYRKLWRITNPNGPELDAANSTNYTFSANQLYLRCPATRDPFDQSRAPVYYPIVTGVDKDRVFDDSYGYNNVGYSSGPNTGYGFVYTNATPLPAVFPRTYSTPSFYTSNFYHATSPYGANQPVAGRFMSGGGTECPQCRRFWFDPAKASCPSDGSTLRAALFGTIGSWSDVSTPAATILVADYAKADASPFPGVDEAIVTESSPTGNVNTAVTGYGFRHGGKLNVLFYDGNVQGYSRASLFSIIGTPKAHWQVYR